MRAHSVRRLPVVDAFDCLEGLLSLDEVILAAHLLAGDRLSGPVHAEVVETMQAIVRPATALVGSPVGARPELAYIFSGSGIPSSSQSAPAALAKLRKAPRRSMRSAASSSCSTGWWW